MFVLAAEDFKQARSQPDWSKRSVWLTADNITPLYRRRRRSLAAFQFMDKRKSTVV